MVARAHQLHLAQAALEVRLHLGAEIRFIELHQAGQRPGCRWSPPPSTGDRPWPGRAAAAGWPACAVAKALVRHVMVLQRVAHAADDRRRGQSPSSALPRPACGARQKSGCPPPPPAARTGAAHPPARPLRVPGSALGALRMPHHLGDGGPGNQPDVVMRLRGLNAVRRRAQLGTMRPSSCMSWPTVSIVERRRAPTGPSCTMAWRIKPCSCASKRCPGAQALQGLHAGLGQGNFAAIRGRLGQSRQALLLQHRGVQTRVDKARASDKPAGPAPTIKTSVSIKRRNQKQKREQKETTATPQHHSRKTRSEGTKKLAAIVSRFCPQRQEHHKRPCPACSRCEQGR